MNNIQCCAVCGSEYEAGWLKYSLYCGNACKQKAYRARKKEQVLQKSKTMIASELKIYNQIIEAHPKFKAEFAYFHVTHGFEPAIDMMLVVYTMLGEPV